MTTDTRKPHLITSLTCIVTRAMTTATGAGAASAAGKEQPAPAKLLQELLDEYKKVNKKADKPVPTGIKPRGTCGTEPRQHCQPVGFERLELVGQRALAACTAGRA